MKNSDVKTGSKDKNQFALLGTSRFAPFFWTQFAGAFNDNVFKNALVIMIAFSATSNSEQSNTLINVAAGLFILPFFLFSATAGQIADKMEKSLLIQRIKLAEIGIMLCAAGAFFFNSVFFLIILLFLMGTQSTFFGPVKYSIIPQHLKSGEIVGGNAMVEMGTFLAILIGTIAGGVLINLENGELWISVTICFVAFMGWLTARRIPPAQSETPDLKIDFNPFTQTIKTIKFAREIRSVFLSIMAISWFWFIGAAYITQLPNYTRVVLNSSEGVVTLLLTMFSIGVGAGSLLCERLSDHKVELGLVPLGSIGLSVFGIDLFLASDIAVNAAGTTGFIQFLKASGSFRIMIDIILIGFFGGLYIVPLFAFIQVKTKSELRARVIAANNIINALYMVLAAIAASLLLDIAELTIPQFFLVIALMNIAVAVYIYSVIPEFLMRFLIWMLSHIMYRVRHKNLDYIPEEGAAVLICNHVSFVDALLIAGSCRRPVRFVMDKAIYNMPILNFIFRTGKAIPITSQHKDPETFQKAFESIEYELAQGEIVCIFPEGKLTRDGEIDAFKYGVEKIIRTSPVTVVPMAICGLWGSFFSHKHGKAMMQMPKRFWSKIELVAGKPLKPENVNAEKLYNIVCDLRGNVR
ncbi:MFS transporter [Desulfobacterales bacterium HSG16]|nr:MFS transporter [Desulfobacterales bacterium HSG16]